MNGAATRRRRRRPMALPVPRLAFLLVFWIQIQCSVVLAQKRGPIQLYIVNDTDEPVMVVWLNNLLIENGELIPYSTGPLFPGEVEVYRANPNDNIELHQDIEGCGTLKKGETYDPQGECLTAITSVEHDGKGENPTSEFHIGEDLGRPILIRYSHLAFSLICYNTRCYRFGTQFSRHVRTSLQPNLSSQGHEKRLIDRCFHFPTQSKWKRCRVVLDQSTRQNCSRHVRHGHALARRTAILKCQCLPSIPTKRKVRRGPRTKSTGGMLDAVLSSDIQRHR